jgi:hypothetical protein
MDSSLNQLIPLPWIGRFFPEQLICCHGFNRFFPESAHLLPQIRSIRPRISLFAAMDSINSSLNQLVRCRGYNRFFHGSARSAAMDQSILP